MCARASADCLPLVIAPNGLFVYRTKLFGGMSAEVLTQFNKSRLMDCLRGTEIRIPVGRFKISLSLCAAHGVIPAGGLAAGTKILVADSAYHRVSEEWQGHVWLPVKLPQDGSNPTVFIFFFSPQKTCLTRAAGGRFEKVSCGAVVPRAGRAHVCPVEEVVDFEWWDRRFC